MGCSVLDTIIGQVFIRRIISSVVIIGMIVAILLFIRWALKDDARFKRIFAICIVVSIVVAAVLGIGLSRIYFDIKNQDYVTYCGEYVERGGGQKDLKTVVIYDEQGNEIRLLRSGPSEKGTYEGAVVYGRRSKIVVEYKGVPKQ